MRSQERYPSRIFNNNSRSRISRAQIVAAVAVGDPSYQRTMRLVFWPAYLLCLIQLITTCLCSATTTRGPAETQIHSRHSRRAPKTDHPRLATLKPRDNWSWHMGDDWLVDYHDFTCLLPVSTAAATLQSFYEDLAGYAALTTEPLSERIQIWLGDITLEVSAPIGTNVEWISIQGFAMEMLEMTKRGYTNTYLINFVHRPSGKLVTFSLLVGAIRGF